MSPLFNLIQHCQMKSLWVGAHPNKATVFNKTFNDKSSDPYPTQKF